MGEKKETTRKDIQLKFEQHIDSSTLWFRKFLKVTYEINPGPRIMKDHRNKSQVNLTKVRPLFTLSYVIFCQVITEKYKKITDE